MCFKVGTPPPFSVSTIFTIEFSSQSLLGLTSVHYEREGAVLSAAGSSKRILFFNQAISEIIGWEVAKVKP